ncbi:MAG: hypothetical protein O2923_15030 [Verrucomicrobia bacterium]|nr:hypothetical protein [Verrucomicrobiota bacterium]
MSRIVAKLMLLIGTCIVGLLILEVGARVLAATSRSRGQQRLDEEVLAAAAEAGADQRTFNVYYFGGSTMRGSVFAPQFTIPKAVNYMLDEHVAGRPVRSINLADSGMDLEDSVSRLLRVVARKDDAHPDLLVVYSGHNEFLKAHTVYATQRIRFSVPYWLRSVSVVARRVARSGLGEHYRLEIDERRLLDEPIVQSAEREAILDRYRSILNRAASVATDAGVPLIISTVACNVLDWEPNRSVYRCDHGSRSRFEQTVASGADATHDEDDTGAMAAFRSASEICATFSELQYRLGQTAFRLGDLEQARAALVAAVDHDGMAHTSRLGAECRNSGSGQRGRRLRRR